MKIRQLWGSLALGAMLTGALAAPAPAAVYDGAADLLGAWVDVQEDGPGAWSQAWLRVEAAQSRWLDQSFYVRMPPTEKAALIGKALEAKPAEFPKQMQQLSELDRHWAEDSAAVMAGFEKEFGHAPQANVYLWYAMSPQKAVAAQIDGQPSVAVNARLLLPYSSKAVRLLLARALLVHAQAEWGRDRAEAIPASVAGRLQSDGLAMWAVSRVVPGLGLAELFSLTPAQAAMLTKGQTAIAREILAALDSGAPDQLDRFFGTQPPEGWPPSSGRYMGLLVATEVARELGGAAVTRLSHKAYTDRARTILKRLAGPAH